MLTKTQKRVLTERKTKKGVKASGNYRNLVKFRLRKKASRALADLEFLAKEYPNAIRPNLLLNVLEAYLNQEKFKITKEERKIKRLPPSLGRKRIPKGERWSQIGYLRSEKGQLLTKELGKKFSISHRLLQIIYQGLKDVTPMTLIESELQPFLILTPENLRYTTLYYPRKVLEGKVAFSYRVIGWGSENSANNKGQRFVLWRY